MWYDDLPAGHTWAALWYSYVLCGGSCRGIRNCGSPCPVCGAPEGNPYLQIIDVNGRKIEVSRTEAGAEGRYEDYIYLQLLQREWERPVVEFERFSHYTDDERPSARAALVLLFWGYFETRVERLHRSAMRSLPTPVLDDELRRYSQIGSRLFSLRHKSWRARM